MKKAILFWFYKEPEICLNRLRILKEHNPGLKIFWLFGGKKNEEKKYKNMLGKYVDDFYTLQSDDPHWKRANWDLALQERYKERWLTLDWDSVFIIQRDLLIFDSLEKMFKDYKKNQIFLSGTRVLDAQVEPKREWTSSKEEKPKYIEFKRYINHKYNYNGELLCCLPMFEILPRKFFEKYGKIDNPELWFIEYRKPTYARILCFDFYQKDLWIFWFQDKSVWPMNAKEIEIKKGYIQNELSKKDWRRMFHPYYKIRE